MPIPLGLQVLRAAEARREKNDDIVHGWNEEGALLYAETLQELQWARRGVAILEQQCQRFERYAPAQAQPQQQSAAPRIAPVKKEAQGG